MRNRTAILLSIMAILTVCMSPACNPKPGANNSATLATNTANTANAANAANTNQANTAADQPVNTNTANAPVSNSLATPTDAYKTAYAMRKKGDIEGLKKVMSKDVIKFMTEMGTAEKKSLDEMLQETVKDPQWQTDEVRNEKIDGDRATVEYIKKDGNWTTMDFEKVGNDWKIAFPKPGPGDKGPKPPQ